MSYSINGKIFTSHALMDEIIYSTKQMIKDLVLKNEKLADSYETEFSMQQADYYIACLNGSMELSFFPLSKEILIAYGCTELQAIEWAADYTKIPEELQDEVLSFCSDYFVENYVEYNNYYRRLNGQPDYNPEHPDDYNITLGRYDYYDDEGDIHNQFDDLFSKDFTNSDFDHDLPLHKFSVTQINTLESLGVMDAIRKIEIDSKNDSSTKTIVDPDGTVRVIDDRPDHYRYLSYLGSRQIDIYTARTAKNWDILYTPSVEYLVQDRFMELYRINRDIYERRTYQLAYSESSDYFDEIVILLIIGQTFADMITDTPEWYIRRDVFDLRTVQYFLTSQGVKFFEDIPMKYQIRIVKGMNKLIKYKSTDKNIFDILELFDVKGIIVFKYYIMKHYLYSDVREFVVIGEEDPDWTMEAEYDFGDEETEDIGDTGDGEGHDVPGAEVYDFVDMSDDTYIDPDAAYDYWYDFRSEDADYFADESYFMEDEYDFYNEDEFPDEINNTSIDGMEDNVKNELFDFGLLSKDVIENYDERELVYDFNSEDSGNVVPTETTDRHLNYQEKIKVIKDEFGNVFELQFVKTPVGEEYDDYIKNVMYRENYDTITRDDPYWDGEDVHYLVRNNHLKKDFTIEGTKYLGVEYRVDMQESIYEKAYYLGTLLNAKIDTEDVTITIPQLSSKKFTLLNLLIFVYCLNGVYTDTETPIEDVSKSVATRTEPKPDFDPYTDFDGGFVWVDPVPPEPVPDPEPFYGYDDYGDEDVEDFDPDNIEVIKDFGYNYSIDWTKEEYYENYDYGFITPTSQDDDYTPQPKPPAHEDPEFDYPYDAYVYVDPNRPYYYCNSYYLDQTTGERTFITPEFMDEHPELIGNWMTIIFLWTEWTDEQLGYYTIDLDNHGVDDWNDQDQYELHVDGGPVRYSSRITHQTFYDYIRTDHPDMFVDCMGRVFGFNMENNLDDIADAIGFRHSEFGFERGYTLADCGVDTYISRKKISSIAELEHIYQTNTACYKNIQNKIRFAETRDERRVLEYVFNKLFTRPWNTAFYILQNGEMANYYAEILKERDYNLYSIYMELLAEGDSSLRIFNTRNCLNDIAETLNYYIHGDNLEFVLSFISTMSYDSLLHYVNEMIDFFKSWKLHFLDPRLSYTINAKNENSAAYGDQIGEFRVKYWTPENLKTADCVEITPLYGPEERPGDENNPNLQAEVIDLANHYVEIDPLADKNYDGYIAEDQDEYFDLDGGGVHPLTEEELQYAIDNNINVTNLDCSPYYQVDCGEISARADLYNLDGGGVLDAREYLDIDGFHLNDPRRYVPHEPYPREVLPEAPDYDPLSGYDVEGGSPNIHCFNGGSIMVTIDKYNQIESNIVRNNYKTNGLEIKDDGIFFSKDPYVKKPVLEREIIQAKTFKNNTLYDLKKIYNTAIVLNPEGAKDVVIAQFANIIRPYSSVKTWLMRNNEQSIIDYYNHEPERLKSWFRDENPFNWTAL